MADAPSATTEDRSTFGNVFMHIPVSTSEDSMYPFNKVRRTLSGHQFEEDDTLGGERLKRTHCSGTYEELQPDGTKVFVVTGDDYSVVIRDNFLEVRGNINITCHGECNVTSNGDMNVTTNGDMNVNVKGNRRTRIDGNDFLEVTGDVATNVEANHKTIVNGEKDLIVKGQSRTTVYKGVKKKYYDDVIQVTEGELLEITNRKHIVDAGEVDIRGLGNLPDKPGESNPFKMAGLGALTETPGISFSSGNDIMMSTNMDGLIYIPHSKILMDHRGIELKGEDKDLSGITVSRGNIKSTKGDLFIAAGLIAGSETGAPVPKIEAEHTETNKLTAGTAGIEEGHVLKNWVVEGTVYGKRDIIAGRVIGVSLKRHIHTYPVHSGITRRPIPLAPSFGSWLF